MYPEHPCSGTHARMKIKTSSGHPCPGDNTHKIYIGELIGRIRVLQRILRRPISDETELLQKGQADLQKMLQALEEALQDTPVMS